MNNMEKAHRPISWPQEGVAGQTGSWRSVRPVINNDLCIHCQICWIFCPDAVVDRATADVNYTYCKGCGICAHECPVGAITMVPEEVAE